MVQSAAFWIKQLKLKQHPEGGYYREIYRSGEFIQKRGLPARYTSYRSFSTSIYYLLDGHQFSAFHRLRSDEGWHFYQGSPVELFLLFPNGKMHVVKIGPDPTQDQHFHFVIPKGVWFAAKPLVSDQFSLVGCTVAPGFDFDDFEIANPDNLARSYPQHQDIILKFSRKDS